MSSQHTIPLQKEMTRTEQQNSNSPIKQVVSIPRTCQDSDTEGERFENDEVFSLASEVQDTGYEKNNRSPKRSGSADNSLQAKTTGIVSALSPPHITDIEDYDSDSDSEFEFEVPRLSQADLNDRSRQMKLSNMLDF